MANISHFTQTVNGVSTTYDIHDANAIPRSGGAVMTGGVLGRAVSDSSLILCGGMGYDTGATIDIYGANFYGYGLEGALRIRTKSTSEKLMHLYPSGTWTWNGTACQITSDQRLKQQIAEIDDKLLDAWEIDSACKSHNVDVSQYGLYCHEEYPEETEEVEVEHEDGTKVKEKKVIREASEHYSLRYTEVYAVECMYLRRENSRLKEKLANLEERLEKLEKAENSENQEK